MKEIKLKNLIARYDMDKRILQQHPENSSFLLERIERHKGMIADYILESSDIRQMAKDDLI